MKAKIYFLAALLLATMGVCGCGSDNDEDKALVQSRWSGCKNESINDETRNSNQSPWEEENVEYESKNGGQLYLKHVNALFNCATENVEVTATVNGRCISIVERGIGNSANCICPMDVECLLRGLSAGKYTISIYKNKDSESDLQFSFTIDYNDSLKGLYKRE